MTVGPPPGSSIDCGVFSGTTGGDDDDDAVVWRCVAVVWESFLRNRPVVVDLLVLAFGIL